MEPFFNLPALSRVRPWQIEILLHQNSRDELASHDQVWAAGASSCPRKKSDRRTIGGRSERSFWLSL